MKLAELEPQFLRYVVEDGRECLHHVDTLAEAQGIFLLCPKCFEANHGPVGTHAVICWFRDRGVPAEAVPGPARWGALGTGLDDLTLSPSVQLLGGCRWHGFITSGAVTTC